MRHLPLALLALTASPTSAAPQQAVALKVPGPGSASPRSQALRRGAVEEAKHLPAHSHAERRYLDGAAALLRFDLPAAAAALEGLPKGSPFALELGWQLAHQRRDPRAIATAAAALCEAGDRTGRACVDAEFYAARVVVPTVRLEGPTEVGLSSQAPFPLALGRVLAHETGVIVDTGASQSVISKGLATRLKLATTKQSFPIGVAAGGDVAKARLAVLPELVVGGAQVGTVPVLVVDMPDLERLGIDLILAPQQALAGLTVELDLSAHKLRLSEEPVKPAPDDVVVPYLQAGFDLVIEAQVGGGEPGLFSFDTGMEHAFALGRHYSGEVVGASFEPGKGGAVLNGAGGKSTVQPLGPLPVKLGGAELRPAEGGILTSIPPGKVFQIAGLLGNGLWRDRVVVLDTQAHRILLRAPAAS
jgi:hypothetical protein